VKRFVNKAKEEGLGLFESKDFQAIAGHGIEATIDSKRILLGNLRLMEERKVFLNGLLDRAERFPGRKDPNVFGGGGEGGRYRCPWQTR